MAAALGSRAGRALHAAVAVTLSPRHVAPTTLSRSVLGQPPAAAWSRCALAPIGKRGYSTFMGVSAKRASDGAPLNVDAMLLNPARFNLVTREWLNLDLPHVAQSVDSVLAAAVPAAPAAGAGAASAGAASAGAASVGAPTGAPTAGAPTAGAASAGAGAGSSTSTDAAASPPASAPAASSAAAGMVDKAGGEGSTDPKTEEPMTLRDVVSNYPNYKLWSYLAGTRGLAMHTFLGDLHAQHPQALIRSYYCFDSEMYAIEVRPPLHDDDDDEDNSSLHSFFEKMAAERATYCRGKVSSTSRSTEECGCAGIQQVLKLDNLCTSAPATPTATIASMLKLNEGKRPSKKASCAGGHA
ncbi:MAG: hypothetical protein EOO41_01225 [Methanobacteriota archaeon]|nr:MAG: hypothetical protein EOO41_01225 [Euryarchaeota archaeon]